MGLGKLPWFERVTLGASAVTLVLALASWGLMRVGAYSLTGAFGLVFVIGGAALATGWLATQRHGRRATGLLEGARTGHASSALAATALCLAFGALYAIYPTYFLLGGQDPGPYLAFSARIAKTGGLHLTMPEVTRWVLSHPPGWMRSYPAVYGDLAVATGPHRAEAQFLHLFTAFLANFFGLGGVTLAVRANAWLAVLCLGVGFALLRRLAAPAAAIAFVVVLGLNPAFVWASRITLTETLALLINLIGLLLLLLAWDLERVWLGALGGAVLGVGVLNRLDGGVGALAVLGFGLAALAGAPLQRRTAIAATLCHLAVGTLALLDAWRLSPVYCHELTSGSSAARLLPKVTAGLDLLALAVALLPARWARALTAERSRGRLARALVVGSLAWLTWGLLIRPRVAHDDDARAMSELTWYIGWVAWPLSIAGAVRAVRSLERALPLVVFMLGTLFIYTFRTDVAPVHIWASRRWVQHAIPLTLACAVLGAEWLLAAIAARVTAAHEGSQKRVAACGAALLLGAYLAPALSFDRPFLATSMLGGLADAYEQAARAARRRPDLWPVLTTNHQLGSILSYVYDVPTVVLREPGAEALEHGELVGSLTVGLDAFDLHHAVTAIRYAGPYLERTAEHRPRDLFEQRMTLDVGEVAGPTYDFSLPAAHPAFHTQVGRPTRGGGLTSNRSKGSLLYGPWTTLVPGRYRVEWYGYAETLAKQKVPALFDVIFDHGKQSLGQAPLALGRPMGEEQLLAAVGVTLGQRTQDVEFRVRVEPRVQLTVNRVRLQRFGGP